MLLVHLDDEVVFLWSPVSSNDIWVEHVMPPFSALPTESTIQISCYDHPVLSSKFVNFFYEYLVFLFSPLAAEAELVSLLCIGRCLETRLWSSFNISAGSLLLRVFDKNPPFETPDFSFIRHKLAQPMPTLLSINLNQSAQFIVLSNRETLIII